MGLFDTVRCDYPLPDPAHQDLEFQTKSLESLLDHFTITHDGRLIRHVGQGLRGTGEDVECAIHGDLRMYTSLLSEGPEQRTWIEYLVRFTHGKVEWARPAAEDHQRDVPSPLLIGWDLPAKGPSATEPKAGARAVSPPDATALEAEGPEPSDPEAALLFRLRRDRIELETLLRESSDHWGYEDPIYRFYHQSFKVYGLQQRTQAIVDRLQALAPDLPLNPWFVEIVRAGTGKEFKIEDNTRWTEATRPIVEAFFHTRFFLEMAVRYAHLEAPPQMLPSGYAALLSLFGLR